MKNIITTACSPSPPLLPPLINEKLYNYWRNVVTGEFKKFNKKTKIWEDVRKWTKQQKKS